MVKCKCKQTQQLLWLKYTHIQVSVQIHTTGRRNACGPRQRWRDQHPWRQNRPWTPYILLLLLLMSDLQMSSNTNLWEEPSNILGGSYGLCWVISCLNTAIKLYFWINYFVSVEEHVKFMELVSGLRHKGLHWVTKSAIWYLKLHCTGLVHTHTIIWLDKDSTLF